MITTGGKATTTHTRACYTKAVICAVENARDTEHMTDQDFLVFLSGEEVTDWADLYLNEGMVSCTCK